MTRFILLACFALFSANASEPQVDAKDFLHFYHSNLTAAHRAIVEGSVSREFVRFRGYSLIDYAIYQQISKQEIQSIPKPLLFFSGFFAGKPLYSEFGGVSVLAYIDDSSKPIHLNFQGRYFSDILAIGKQRFYALCALSAVNRCLLLGIGERW